MAPYWVLKSMSTTLGSPPSNGLTFAGVTPADFDELAALRIAAMRESFESVGRFDSERARERLRQSFYPEHTQVIVFGGVRVGFYTFRPVADGFQPDQLYIQPSCRSRGIGSRVIGSLLAEADARGWPVRVGALRDSPANRFYRRRGFVPTREEVWDVYYERRPVIGGSGSRAPDRDAKG